jgi:CelD/BcsL family acetyltransferase involved in cellulose biosynthesis
MLTLLLAVSAAVETPRIVTIPKRARPAVTASTRKRAAARPARKAPAKVARMTKLCVTGNCTPAAASPYRLAHTGEVRFNGKQTRMKCGIEGAPVCPSRARQLTSVPID